MTKNLKRLGIILFVIIIIIVLIVLKNNQKEMDALTSSINQASEVKL